MANIRFVTQVFEMQESEAAMDMWRWICSDAPPPSAEVSPGSAASPRNILRRTARWERRMNAEDAANRDGDDASAAVRPKLGAALRMDGLSPEHSPERRGVPRGRARHKSRTLSRDFRLCPDTSLCWA